MTNEDQINPPHISIVSQYVKDFSFENPKAPESLTKLDKAPSVELALDLNITSIKDEKDTYEVSILIEANASIDDFELFLVELEYAGIFVLENIPKDQHEPILAIHCPNLIFPFARRIISDITQESGFQPLRIDPIDFGRLYQSKLSQEEEEN